MVSKVSEKLVNIRIVDYLGKCGPFSDFQYGFRSSDRISRAFNRSGASRAVTLDIFQAFHSFWHSGLLYKHRSYGISCQIFSLCSSFLSN